MAHPDQTGRSIGQERFEDELYRASQTHCLWWFGVKQDREQTSFAAVEDWDAQRTTGRLVNGKEEDNPDDKKGGIVMGVGDDACDMT